jgi:dipeptidyl aminopeptidase/acylaminoacyl peptidase
MKKRMLGRCLLTGALLSTMTVLVTATPAEAVTCSATSNAAWSTCDEVFSDALMIEEEVEYPGGIGPVDGRVCRPVAAGSHPILVMNHGASATPLTDKTIDDECRERARQGFYVIASNYRLPETTPSPTTDACLGEVDDVIAMIDIARTITYADDTKIGVRGLSLGGCVSLQIHQQGIPGLIAAASINGPTDWTAARNYWRSEYNARLCALLPLGNCNYWKLLYTWIENATGGAPGPATQAAYDARSPMAEADDTAASSVPLALMQGAGDPLVTPAQTCAFAAAVNGQPGGAWDFTPVHYGTRGAGYPVIPTAAASCPGVGTWHSGTTPYPAFPGDHYLAVVDGLAHATPNPDLEDATLWVDTFIASKL